MCVYCCLAESIGVIDVGRVDRVSGFCSVLFVIVWGIH